MSVGSKVLVGGLVVAVLGTVAYVVTRKDTPSTSTPTVGGGAAASDAMPVAEGSLPISVSENVVVSNTGGHQAAVQREDGTIFQWSIEGGTLEGQTHLDTVQWTAGVGPEVKLNCKASRKDGSEVTGSIRVPVQRAPVISRFGATPEVIKPGGTAHLSWAVEQAQALVLEPLGENVMEFKGPTFEVKPTETTTYALVATSRDGITTRSETTVRVAGDPQILAFTAAPGAAGNYSVKAEFTSGKAEISMAGQVVASGESSPLTVDLTDVKVGSVLTLTVKGETGASISQTLTFAPKS